MTSHQPNSLDELPIRNPVDVARRCLVLYAVVAAGHKTSRHDLTEWLQREDLWASLSREELSLFQSSAPSRHQFVCATWRAEALAALLWALGLLPNLPSPTALCDIPAVRSVLPPLLGSTAAFLANAVMRDPAEIIEAHEATYQAHWAVRDAGLRGEVPPKGYNPEIIQERHVAFNWLIFSDQEWGDAADT